MDSDKNILTLFTSTSVIRFSIEARQLPTYLFADSKEYGTFNNPNMCSQESLCSHALSGAYERRSREGAYNFLRRTDYCAAVAGNETS